jgi:glucan phosphoethanolaminetransferase (alkaline phosphatase superfamily)
MLKDNYLGSSRLFLSLFIIIILIGLSLLQSLSSPFEFVQEGIYLLQPYDIKGFLKGGIYFGVYGASLLAIVLAVFARNKIIFIMLITFIAISYGIDLLVQLIGSNDKGLSIGVFSLGMVENSRISDMLLFKTQLLQALGVIILLIFFALFTRCVLFRKVRVNTLLSVSAVFFMSAVTLFVVLRIFSVVAQAFPAPIKTLAIASEYYLENECQMPRVLAETIVPIKVPEYKTIVWLIDESIGGQYLSLNGYEKDTTPYLKHLANNDSDDFQNYGIVPSIANCSASSNLLLRIGLTSHYQGDFKDNLKSLPTIFQYATRAGYKTHLIDAQVAKGQLQNHLSVYDKFDIDNFVTFSRKYVPNMRDHKVLESLKEILDDKKDSLNFVVVVKLGAHWPYPLSYPRNKEVFKPATRESYTEMTNENKELILNSYFNSIRFSVDEFLQSLTENRDLNEQAIIYTSDHGQTLFHNEDPLTHCHSGRDMPEDEFKVPLMIFTKNAREKFRKPVHNVTAQEQLFPTTLSLMGYPESTYASYGPSLNEGAKPDSITSFIMLTGSKIKLKMAKKWGGVSD